MGQWFQNHGFSTAIPGNFLKSRRPYRHRQCCPRLRQRQSGGPLHVGGVTKDGRSTPVDRADGRLANSHELVHHRTVNFTDACNHPLSKAGRL